MLFSAWGQVEETSWLERLYLGHFLSVEAARQRVRDAIGSGCLYGWIMRGHDVIEYVVLESERYRQRFARWRASAPPGSDRKRITYAAPLRLRYEP